MERPLCRYGKELRYLGTVEAGGPIRARAAPLFSEQWMLWWGVFGLPPFHREARLPTSLCALLPQAADHNKQRILHPDQRRIVSYPSNQPTIRP